LYDIVVMYHQYSPGVAVNNFLPSQSPFRPLLLLNFKYLQLYFENQAFR